MLSDGELVFSMAVTNVFRAVGDEYTRERGTKGTLTFHLPRVAIRISFEVYVFGNCTRIR